MKHGIGILLVFVLWNVGLTQKITPTVLSSAGAVMKANNLSIEWTLGELATETLVSGGNILTQGFHQTNLTIVSTQNPGIEGLKIYPNPFISQLTIENKTGERLSFHLIGIHGQCISEYLVEHGVHSLEMDFLPSGSYILETSKGNQTQQFILEKLK